MEFKQKLLVLLWLAIMGGCSHDSKPVAIEIPITSVNRLDTIDLLSRADSLFHLGDQNMKINKKDSAIYFYVQALSLREEARQENSELVESYLKVADLFLEQVKYVVADKYLEKARLMSDRVKIDSGLLVNIYLESAQCKMNILDIAFSNSLLQKALAIIQQKFPNNHDLIFKIHYELAANAYYDKDYEKAINFLNQELLLVPPGDYEKLGRINTFLGNISRRKFEYAKAILFYNRSIKYDLKWSGPDSYPLAKDYLQKGFGLVDVGKIDSARYYLLKNLNIRTKVFTDKDVNTFGAKLSLGQFNLRIGAYDSAARYFQESLVSLITNFQDHNLNANPKPTATDLNRDIILGLVGKAEALKKLGEIDHTDIERRVLSLKTFELADSIFKIFRSNTLNDDSQLRQLGSGDVPYHLMVDTDFQLYSMTGEPVYFEKALNTMERSRAVLLQNSLQKAEAYRSTGIDLSYKQREANLARKGAEVLRSLSLPDLSKVSVDSLNGVLLSTNDALNKLQNEIGLKNPNYFNIKYNSPSVNILELQSLLQAQNSILLEYLWSDSAIYTSVVCTDTVIIHVIHQTRELKNALRDFTMELNAGHDGALQFEHFQKFSKSSYLLYQRLFVDVLHGIKNFQNDTNLIISADGQLSTFPFEALTTQLSENKEVDYRLQYLILDHAISYCYSSGILLRQHKNKREGSKVLAFGFAGNGISNLKRNNNNNLPGTEEELNAIKSIMKNKENKFFLGEEATESVFKKQAGDFDIVHLAVHGMADTENAMESRLIFRSDADSTEDGNLYAHELYDLNLSKNDLTVLSACESGIGKQQAGEGVMSIARGFAYAGCPSLVISLWKIDDRRSALVMSHFYRHLSAGENIDQALANAKTDYLANINEHNSHPSYWAAFLQIGDTRAFIDRGYSWVTWIIGSTIACIISYMVFYWVRRRKLGSLLNIRETSK